MSYFVVERLLLLMSNEHCLNLKRSSGLSKQSANSTYASLSGYTMFDDILGEIMEKNHLLAKSYSVTDIGPCLIGTTSFPIA